MYQREYLGVVFLPSIAWPKRFHSNRETRRLIPWASHFARGPLSASPAVPELRRKQSRAPGLAWPPNRDRAPPPRLRSLQEKRRPAHTPMSTRPGSSERKRGGTTGHCSHAWPHKCKPVGKRWHAIPWTPAKGYRFPPRRPGILRPHTLDSREPISGTSDKYDNSDLAWRRNIAKEKRARNERDGAKSETRARNIQTMPASACDSAWRTKA
jgi:hypothetical protein